MNNETMDVVRTTLEHIHKVGLYLANVANRISIRGIVHDLSKFDDAEIETFVRMTPKLRGMTYGSSEYAEALAEMKPALDHHYKNNRHHPEYWEFGVCQMSLIDLIEMLCDWKAATERHADGDLVRSMKQNRERFGISDGVFLALVNTACELNWISLDDRVDLSELCNAT